ncbi:hypothetical protein OH76DRAFT_1489553 [Lentinus brumalis]|uniref:F-box domain-containing protein n=1 Tax=Lentinus brumalis TaxID=2498619 RepID=A0A371CM35_9APHY|nr:hypothetical protein OH76DRAFT_1489553 [Polyporus brumalis]
MNTVMLPPANRKFAAFSKGLLPQEVLLRIFWAVVPLPHEYDPSIVTGPNSSWMRALRTKKALTLVSRSWHGPAMEVLYSDIVLRRMYQITLLAESLRTSPNARTGLIRGLRLDSCIFTQPEELARARDEIAFIFSSCTKLGSFSYHHPAPMSCHALLDFDPFRMMIPSRPRSESSYNTHVQLRHIDMGVQPPSFAIYVGYAHLSFLEGRALLRTATQLVSLKLGYYTAVADRDKALFEPIFLPCLQDLYLVTDADAHGFTSYVAEAWSMPSLTNLTLARCSQLQTSLLAKHGSRLRYLHMYNLGSPPGVFSLRFECEPLLRLFSLCPVLEHLVLPFVPAQPIVLHTESLRYLDIWHLGPEEEAAWEPKYLRREASFVPSLRCVRLLLTTVLYGTHVSERWACGGPEWPTICHPELLAGKPDDMLYHRISGSWVVQTTSIVSPEFMDTVIPASTDAEDESALQPDAAVLAAVLDEQDLGPADANAEYDCPLDIWGQSLSENESAGSSEWWDGEDSAESDRDDGSDEGMDVEG